MSAHPSIERDFGAPIRFYDAIKLRQETNPIFQRRLLRQRSPLKRALSKYLDVEISEFFPPNRGHLIVALVSVSTHGIDDGPKSHLTVISSKVIPVEKDEDIGSTVQLMSSSALKADKRDLDLLLVVAFHPLRPENAGSLLDAMREHMAKIIEVAQHRLVNIDSDPSGIHICVMDMNIKLATLSGNVLEKKTADTISRSWMWPILASRQEIILSTQPIVKLVDPNFAFMGGQLFADMEVTWSSVKLESSDRDERHCGSNGSSKNSSSNPQTEASATKSPKGPVKRNVPVDSKSSLIYHCVYKDPETQLFHVEKQLKNTLDCIWCGSYFGSYCRNSNEKSRKPSKDELEKVDFSLNPITSSTKVSIEYLLQHLKNCHFHFDYHTMKDQDGNLFIFMMRDRTQDLDVSSLRIEKAKSYFWMNKCEKDRGSLLHYNLATIKIPEMRGRPKGTNEVIAEDLVPTRQYYHPRTGLPMMNEELGYESDEECESWWDLMLANQALDEFEDIGYEEKVFMKMWNTHIASFPPYGDGYLPIVCERFVKKFASLIAAQHLRYHCLFHFMTMYDFGLLRSDEVLFYMTIVDREVQAKKAEEAESNLCEILN